ncbi:hypothetical protein HYH03_010310 [Edaphochlamys debaryana]|uniref:RRM domain-containing protein n=1 Tax=Edaphochlamys debaryana TaxID=47281 RepID=A0A836BXL4_9CHLO|nr:hypothetical protein HYH03_010310 [Edaphochlamys debaryana]|eukprot:KAG2491304.1 hypothetical protein HYH03_010310 [Edaphochlamys debaryana]
MRLELEVESASALLAPVSTEAEGAKLPAAVAAPGGQALAAVARLAAEAAAPAVVLRLGGTESTPSDGPVTVWLQFAISGVPPGAPLRAIVLLGLDDASGRCYAVRAAGDLCVLCSRDALAAAAEAAEAGAAAAGSGGSAARLLGVAFRPEMLPRGVPLLLEEMDAAAFLGGGRRVPAAPRFGSGSAWYDAPLAGHKRGREEADSDGEADAGTLRPASEAALSASAAAADDDDVAANEAAASAGEAAAEAAAAEAASTEAAAAEAAAAEAADAEAAAAEAAAVEAAAAEAAAAEAAAAKAAAAADAAAAKAEAAAEAADAAAAEAAAAEGDEAEVAAADADAALAAAAEAAIAAEAAAAEAAAAAATAAGAADKAAAVAAAQRHIASAPSSAGAAAAAGRRSEAARLRRRIPDPPRQPARPADTSRASTRKPGSHVPVSSAAKVALWDVVPGDGPSSQLGPHAGVGSPLAAEAEAATAQRQGQAAGQDELAAAGVAADQGLAEAAAATAAAADWQGQVAGQEDLWAEPVAEADQSLAEAVAEQQQPQQQQQQHVGGQAPAGGAWTVWIDNLHPYISPKWLMNHISQTAEVTDLQLLTNPDTGQPRAVVELATEADYRAAAKLNGAKMYRQQVKVTLKSGPMPRKPGTGMGTGLAGGMPLGPMMGPAGPMMGPLGPMMGFPRPPWPMMMGPLGPGAPGCWRPGMGPGLGMGMGMGPGIWGPMGLGPWPRPGLGPMGMWGPGPRPGAWPLPVPGPLGSTAGVGVPGGPSLQPSSGPGGRGVQPAGDATTEAAGAGTAEAAAGCGAEPGGLGLGG